MALTYESAVKTARMNAVVAQIDGGASAGKLVIGTTGMGAVLATFTLTDPCGTVSGDTLTFDFDPDIEVAATGSGTAAAAIITDSDDNTLISGLTVGLSGTHIILDSVSITSGQRVILQTGTIQHAA